MFGHRFFGARFFAQRYFGGIGQDPPPPPVGIVQMTSALQRIGDSR